MNFLLKLLTLILRGLNILVQLSAMKNSSGVQGYLGANKAGCNAGYNQFNFRVFQPNKLLPLSSQKRRGLEILSWSECFVALLGTSLPVGNSFFDTLDAESLWWCCTNHGFWIYQFQLWSDIYFFHLFYLFLSLTSHHCRVCTW